MTVTPNGDTVNYSRGGVQSTAEMVVIGNPDGSSQSALPPGRATAANSVPVALSSEDYARLSQTYRRAAAVNAGAGDAVFVTGVTTAGTVTLTLSGGGTVTVSVPIGSSTLPFSATAAALGTAVGGTFQNLFFT